MNDYSKKMKKRQQPSFSFCQFAVAFHLFYHFDGARDKYPIIYCAFENRASQKAHPICRIPAAFAGKVNAARFYNMCAPIVWGPRKSQRAKRCEIFGEKEQQVYEGLAASYAHRLPFVALLRRAPRRKTPNAKRRTESVRLFRWGCPQNLDNLFCQLKTNCENLFCENLFR